jgi:hypothetical protein
MGQGYRVVEMNTAFNYTGISARVCTLKPSDGGHVGLHGTTSQSSIRKVDACLLPVHHAVKEVFNDTPSMTTPDCRYVSLV